jgi:EmrB/QacA subfamily drug resistance transporter
MQATATLTAVPAASTFRIRTILAPLAAVVLGTFMAILDSTVVNVAVPTLQHVFRADLQLIQWVVTAYMLAQAAIIPLAGWLSDRFSIKTVYITALVLFTLGSLLCAVAQNAQMLIAFRILQGLGGGMLMPLALAYVFRLTPPEKRGAAMGTVGIPILLGPAFGPILAGWFLQYADWRYIFLINIPVGVVAVLVATRALPALSALRAPGRIDLPGAILGPLGFAALSYGISQSASMGWGDRNTIAGLAIGGVSLLLFAARELTTEEPLLDLRVFLSADFSLTIVTQWVVQAAMFAGFFFLPLFLQQVRGYGALDTGVYLLPQALGSALLMPVGGKLFDKIGARPLVVVGSAILLFTTYALAQLSATTTGTDLLWLLFARGASMGLMMMSLQTQLMAAAPRALISRVSALSNALTNVVASLAIAGLSTYLFDRVTTHLAAARHAIASYQQTLMAQAAAHHGIVPAGAGRATPPHAMMVAMQHYATHATQGALARAFDDMFLTSTGVVGLAVLLAFTLRRHPQAAEDSEDAVGGMEMMVA